MRKKELSYLALVAFLAMNLWGCGSSMDSSGSDTEDDTLASAQTLGIDNCLTCHLSAVAQVWLDGVHGNPDLQPLPGLNTTECLACHDQLGDGVKLLSATNGSEPNRPVVGCESCHGGGQYHSGIGPLPDPKPGYARCGQCHDASYPHGDPEATNIVEDFQVSPHTRSINANVVVTAGSSDVRARCSKCHTDEGAKLYKDIDGNYAALNAALPNSAPAISGASAIDCRTCHQPHNEQTLLEAASTGRSPQFNTCTNCHQLLEAGLNAAIAGYHDPTVNSYGAYGEIITDSHFDNPATGTTSAGTTVEGYVVRAALDSACSDCHNPHNADNTVNRQWAESAHGGHIGAVKESAEAVGGNVFAAGATDASGIAWTHYNWDKTNDTIPGDRSGRSACQRCHTATGVSNFLTNPAAYDPLTNDFSHLTSWTATGGSSQQELLYCWGCHSDSKGSLRNPGAITENYAAVVNAGTGTTGTAAQVVYPDISNSNVCMACHLGREIGQNITNTTDDNGVLSFINSHYLTAGATLFNVSGYEYDSLSYADPAYFAHAKIGTTAAPGTGSSGPCVGCHMSSSDKHLFLPVTRNETSGAITAITSTLCVQCHSGNYALSAAILEAESEEYHAALEALNQALLAKGIEFKPAYPYFYIPTTSTAFTNWESIYPGFWQDTMGAAFNYNLLHHDPGGYAHNRFYAKRLIFDAIDWIDNGVLEGTIDLTDQADAAAYLNAASPITAVARP